MALRTEGKILFPRSKTLQILYDNLVSDQALFEDLLDIILKRRYLQPRRTPKTRDEFDLEKLFNMPNADFQQAARTTKAGFMQVLDEICMNPVFLCRSIRPQLPIPHQLALTLERLGSNENGASVGRFSRNLNVGQGTVVKVTRRVLKAILSLGRRYVSWPDAARRAQTSEVMADKGFPGCVGFVDGTTIPLFQRPGFDGKVFYDQKQRYSINAQIVCDCNKYITSFITRWPGSCGDSRVYKQMQLHQNPSKFFDEGQYLLADSAYELTKTVVPAYKSPASNLQLNSDFNLCLAKARVRNEHMIGVLKSHRSSLREMRLHLYRRSDMREYVVWLYCCIVLHNMLAQLGDQWANDYADSSSTDTRDPVFETKANEDAENFRDRLTKLCVCFNYKEGVLPA
ncbi:hypothetical protein PCASD_22697 [Puccinia coronata f. sp. avenae]|uniref:DDE Tnp4 domain-containing protein n=1 Tax=Puccinia coronata f. sp. avenae TaxID=200324 RepID=A0A2N5TTE1_9BASI|nr:hypothetical protein PCASD_22697 [Puccinia coronata f. sp. avenae]